MILQALKEYYDRKISDPESDIAPEGWERKEIPFIIVLDKQGNLLQIEDTREGEGKKKQAKIFLVPQAVKKTSGIAANLLWDVSGYVFGVDNKDKPQRALQQKEAFIGRLRRELGTLERVKPIICFLETVTDERLQRESLWPEIVETNPNLTFRYSGETTIACDCSEIRELLSIALEKDDKLGTCLVTGSKSPIAVLHTAIKGVYGAQSSGANIVSFNLEAFRSFTKEQGLNAPVGKSVVFEYTTAVNNLLSKGSNQRLTIGDASTVFWSEKQSAFESDLARIFSEPTKDNPEEVLEKIRALLASVDTGSYCEDPGNVPFYILGLAPNAARLSVRFWQQGTISEFADRIRTHFSDLAIVKPPIEPEYYSLWRLLVNVAMLDKSENISPVMAGDFMRAILAGTPYPITLLQAALRRIKSDAEHRVKPVRAALIKGYLNRYQRAYAIPNQKEIQMSLDKNQPSTGYQLGRLFAVLEKIQERGNPGSNTTIRDRYYGVACSRPSIIFAKLMQFKNYHRSKIDHKGSVLSLERLLGEILVHIDNFPSHLDLFEQGRFAIGYYHQRQDFFAKKEIIDAQQ